MTQQERRPCRFCNDPIALNAIARHELMCERLEPKTRAANTLYRRRALDDYYRMKGKPRLLKVAKSEPAAANGKLSLNGGGRLALTISLDVKTLSKLLLELAPAFKLDKVTVS